MRETEAPGKAETGNERDTGKDRDRQATDKQAPREGRIDKREGEGVEKGGTERDRQTESRTHRGAGKDKGGTERDKKTETQAERCRERQRRH